MGHYIPTHVRRERRRALVSFTGLFVSFVLFLSIVSLTSIVQASFIETTVVPQVDNQEKEPTKIVERVALAEAPSPPPAPTPVEIPHVTPPAPAIEVRVANFPLEKNWPVLGRITTTFSNYHLGIDIAAPKGSPLHTFASGVVVQAGWFGANSFGNAIVIRHVDGWETLYGHLNSIAVSVGQEVNLATVIGTVGMTGRATGPHVHFQLSQNGRYVNPLSYLP